MIKQLAEFICRINSACTAVVTADAAVIHAFIADTADWHSTEITMIFCFQIKSHINESLSCTSLRQIFIAPASGIQIFAYSVQFDPAVNFITSIFEIAFTLVSCFILFTNSKSLKVLIEVIVMYRVRICIKDICAIYVNYI